MSMQPSELDQIRDFQQPAGSETRFRRPLCNAEIRTAHRAEILTQIARAQGLQGAFTDGHRTLDESDATLGTDPTLPRAITTRPNHSS
jgi:hypothetical protein